MLDLAALAQVKRSLLASLSLELSRIWFFVQKWPFRDAKLFSEKWVAETKFESVVWVAFFGQVVKKGKEILDTHQKKGKTD